MPATLQTSLSPLTFIASSFQPPPLPPSLPIFFLSLSLSLSLVSRFPSFSPIFILQPREFSSRRDSLLLFSFLKDKRRVEKRDGGAYSEFCFSLPFPSYFQVGLASQFSYRPISLFIESIFDEHPGELVNFNWYK